MDPRMIEILKRAKAIDKAAEKFDNGAPKRNAKSTNLMSEVSNISGESFEQYDINPTKKNINSDDYAKAVQTSKLPAAIQKAMLENPIPQPSMGFDVDDTIIKEIRGVQGPDYNEEDEIDFYEKPIKKKVIRETKEPESINIDESYLRKLISSEIAKALPKIMENYFEKRLVKENVQFKAGNTVFSGNVMPMPKVKSKNNTI